MKLLKRLKFLKKGIQYERYNLIISEFYKSLSLIIDAEQLRANVMSKLQEIIQIDKILLFTFHEDYQRYVLSDVIGANKNAFSKYYFQVKDKLISWFLVNENALFNMQNKGVFSYLTNQEQLILKKMDISYVYPLKVMNRLIGLFFLGQKINGKPYSKEELELLTMLMDQSAFAFENINLYKNQRARLKKMYRADRLAMMGQLAAGAAHEIRNPLTSIRSTIQYVKKDITNPTKAQMVAELIVEVDRINEIIQGMLSFSNPEILHSEIIDLNHLIQQSLLLISNSAKKKNCEIKVLYLAENENLFADPSQMKQVILNLIMNSLDSVKEEGKIVITVDVRNNKEERFTINKKEFVITIEDNGTGIANCDLEKIFDPFYTTKKEGTGLGLSISYGIILKHGGDISIDSNVGEGTKVTIILPAS